MVTQFIIEQFLIICVW